MPTSRRQHVGIAAVAWGASNDRWQKGARAVVDFLSATGTPEELARVGYDGTTWDQAQNLPRGQLTTAERMPSAELGPGGPSEPIPTGPRLDVGGLPFTDPLTGRAMTGDELLDRRLYTDALAVVQGGHLVYETYRDGMTESDRHVAHSCSKTLTTMMVGIALEEGRLERSRPIGDYVPELASISAWQPVTLEHVLDMATGVDLEENYEDADSMYWRYADAVGYYARDGAVPSSTLAFVTTELTRSAEPPGERFNYGSYLTNLLPIALANVYDVPAVELYEDRIYRHLGAERPALVNLDSAGNPIVEGQVNLTLRDFLRWGYLLVDHGRSLSGTQVVPATWVDDTYAPSAARAAAFARGAEGEAMPGVEYHNQTWVLEPGRVVTMLGIHGQFCWVDRQTATMIVGFSSYPVQTHALLSATLRELWSGVRAALAG
jgi:CubicO group peptidase (beta-lactamase class C family)